MKSCAYALFMGLLPEATLVSVFGGLTETIAHVSIGQKVSGMGRVILDLQAELANESAQILQLITVLWAPNGLKQPGMRDRHACMAHQAV